MARLLTALISAIIVAVGIAGAAAAAPGDQNKNAETILVDCENLGILEIVTVEHAATGFGADGRVFVGMRFAEDVQFTVTTFDGETFGPFSDPIEEGAPGSGFESRLIRCTFTDTFTDTFALDVETADFFGIPAGYVGTEVTIEGAADGVVWVIDPGR